MATLRSGKYGVYYGSTQKKSEVLTETEQQANALYIAVFLNAKGWSKNAVAAILGNMQAESSINPGRWQNDDVGNTANGYGLVQWTPATKYIDWCSQNSYSDYSEMDSNLSRIIYEVENDIQWIGVGDYDDMTFSDFSTSNLTVSELAKAFLLCYERPADQSDSVQSYRATLAESWYSYLSGETPDQPGTTNTKKKSKYKFILFKRRTFLG